jgi:hypothetical protein
LRFFASCQPCAARAAGTTIYTGWHGSFAAVSLFTRRSATRFRQPGTTGPDLLRFRSGSAPGILHPSQYSLPADPGVCFRRSSPHAVCRSFNTAAFYGCRPPCLNSFRASRARYGQLPNDPLRLLGFLPQASQTGTHQAMRPINPALGFVVFSQAFRCCPGATWINQKAPKIMFALTTRQGRGTPPPCMHASEQTAPRRNHPRL